jgi:hypothetical protein
MGFSQIVRVQREGSANEWITQGVGDHSQAAGMFRERTISQGSSVDTDDSGDTCPGIQADTYLCAHRRWSDLNHCWRDVPD